MSKRSIRIATMAGLVALVGTTAAACGTTSSTSSATKPLATVNGQPITVADWQLAVHGTELLNGVSMATGKSAEKQQVTELASELAVEQWALKHHVVSVATAQKNAKLFVNENVSTALGGAAKMKTALAAQHLTVASLTQFMVQQMELQAAFSQETKSVKPATQAQALAYYNANKSLFVSPPQDEMRMILVKTKSLAESLMTQLEHGGSWKALAAKYSLDPGSKNKGGEYGWVNTGPSSNFVTPFYQEMDKLKPGQYGIAHTQYGYHVIEVQATRPGATQTFASVQSQLTTQLTQQAQDKVFQAFSNKITKESHVKINI
ncbi:MAG: peptidylprolyl isomerase [Firmicutes bacterium]|nr:peptidylprolyl isomerase [Bacillota bacterium]